MRSVPAHSSMSKTRRIAGQFTATCHSQPALKSAKVWAPFLIGDDDLAVEDRRSRQALAGLGQFWEPVSKVLALPARQSDEAVA